MLFIVAVSFFLCIINIQSVWLLTAWCFSTVASAATMLKTHPCVSSFFMGYGTKEAPLNDGVLKWKLFQRYWPFVWGIQRPPVNSHHKGQWRGALMFSLICAWTNGWVNNRGVIWDAIALIMTSLSVFTKCLLQSLSWPTICFERPQNSMVVLYRYTYSDLYNEKNDRSASRYRIYCT